MAITMTMAMILALPRRLVEGERLVRDNVWDGWAPTHMLGRRVWGKRLGIIGMGRIGQAVARRAKAFGMAIHYYSREKISPQAEEALEAREREAVGRWQQFSHSWRAAWTPGRIVVVGLVSGFVAGRTQPMVAGGGGGLLALVRTFAPLLAGLQAGAQTAEAAKE